MKNKTLENILKSFKEDIEIFFSIVTVEGKVDCLAHPVYTHAGICVYIKNDIQLL